MSSTLTQLPIYEPLIANCNENQTKKPTIIHFSQLLEHFQKRQKAEEQQWKKEGGWPQLNFNEDNTYLGYYRNLTSCLPMLKQMGLTKTKMHHLRHVCCCVVFDAGVSNTNVQHQLGHHSPTFTVQLYSHTVKKSHAITACIDPGFFAASAQLDQFNLLI